MVDQGVTYDTTDDQYVFSFPTKSPKGSVQFSAVDQLNLWATYQEHYCEHKPSMTCYFNDDNFLDVGAWIWDHFGEVSGIAFFPEQDWESVFEHPPYTRITKEQYEASVKNIKLDYSKLPEYETEDNTEVSKELACSGLNCEI
jgi:ribonucleoside-triphosphate reductase (thioredoxin)